MRYLYNHATKGTEYLTRLNVSSCKFSLGSKVATNEFSLYVEKGIMRFFSELHVYHLMSPRML